MGPLPAGSRPVVDIITSMSFSRPRSQYVKWCSLFHQQPGEKEALTSQSFPGQVCHLHLPKVSAVSGWPPIPALAQDLLPPLTSCLSTTAQGTGANLTYTLQLDGPRTRGRGLFPGGNTNSMGTQLSPLSSPALCSGSTSR